MDGNPVKKALEFLEMQMTYTRYQTPENRKKVEELKKQMEEEEMGYKFVENKPEKFKFRFDTGRKSDIYDSYSYGVEIDGSQEYLNASPALHEMIKKYEPLKDKELIIEKQASVEEGKKITRWGVTSPDGKEPVQEKLPETKIEKKEVDWHKEMEKCIDTVAKKWKEHELSGEISAVVDTLFMKVSK